MGTRTEHKRIAADGSEFGQPQAALNGDQKKSVIAASGPRALIGSSKQGLDFRSGQESDLSARKSLAGNGQDTLDLLRMGWRFEGCVAKEGTDGGESQVAAAGRNAARVLHVLQECGNQRCVDLLEC